MNFVFCLAFVVIFFFLLIFIRSSKVHVKCTCLEEIPIAFPVLLNFCVWWFCLPRMFLITLVTVRGVIELFCFCILRPLTKDFLVKDTSNLLFTPLIVLLCYAFNFDWFFPFCVCHIKNSIISCCTYKWLHLLKIDLGERNGRRSPNFVKIMNVSLNIS